MQVGPEQFQRFPLARPRPAGRPAVCTYTRSSVGPVPRPPPRDRLGVRPEQVTVWRYHQSQVRPVPPPVVFVAGQPLHRQSQPDGAGEIVPVARHLLDHEPVGLGAQSWCRTSTARMVRVFSAGNRRATVSRRGHTGRDRWPQCAVSLTRIAGPLPRVEPPARPRTRSSRQSAPTHRVSFRCRNDPPTTVS